MAKNAVRRDMTSGSIAKHIFLFSLPLMAGQFLQQCYNLVDGIVVSNFVVPTLPTAFASVNVTSSMTFLFIAIALGMSTGTGIMVAQYFGARKYYELRRTVTTSMLFLLIVSVILSVLGFVFARLLLKGVLGVQEGALLDGAVEYLAIYCLGLVFQFMYNVAASVLRAVGDSRASLYFLLVSTVLNVVLDLVFVLVFHWGIAGTAIATVIAQFASALVAITYMFKRYEMLRFVKGETRIEGQRLKMLIRLSLPATLQQAVVCISGITMQRLVISFGQDSISAYGAVSRLQNFALIPAMSLHTGLVTFTGQNVGAGFFDRVKRAQWITVGMSTAICCVVSVILFIFTDPLLEMFNMSGEALVRAHAQLRYLVFVLWVLGLLFVSYGVLQGAGDVVPPTIGSFTSLILRVVFAYMFAAWTGFGWQSVYIVHPISTVLACAITYGRYFSMKWKTKAIANRAPAESEQAESAE